MAESVLTNTNSLLDQDMSNTLRNIDSNEKYLTNLSRKVYKTKRKPKKTVKKVARVPIKVIHW